MNIIVAGASGLIGRSLVSRLEERGHSVLRLVRRKAAAPFELTWNPVEGELDPSGLEGCQALINLAGENIASGRWTAARKALIRSSRVRTTSTLASTFARMKQPPHAWVNASAIGYYGNRGEEQLTEQSEPGTGFLAETCQDWEQATASASHLGVRIVRARIGVVLTPEGGALAKMLPPFRMGVGGPMGSGDQFMSWISLDDVVSGLVHCAENPSIDGAVNLVSPRPETNTNFSRELGRAIHRPARLPMPALAARLAFGEMADALLLSSTRVLPARLEHSGFSFRHPSLSEAFLDLLGQSRREAA